MQLHPFTNSDYSSWTQYINEHSISYLQSLYYLDYVLIYYLTLTINQNAIHSRRTKKYEWWKCRLQYDDKPEAEGEIYIKDWAVNFVTNELIYNWDWDNKQFTL